MTTDQPDGVAENSERGSERIGKEPGGSASPQGAVGGNPQEGVASGPSPGFLTREQALALRQLMLGMGVNSAAAEAKVNRTTIFRWMRKNDVFVREIREWRTAARELARQRLFTLVPAALELVERAVQSDELWVSMAVAKATRLLHRLDTAEAELGEGEIS